MKITVNTFRARGKEGWAVTHQLPLVLTEDQGLAPSTHVTWRLTTAQNSSHSRHNALFWTPQVPSTLHTWPVHAYLCVWKRDHMCVWERAHVCERAYMYVCVRVCVKESACVYIKEREHMYVCTCVCVKERACVYKRQYTCMCVYMCIKEHMCV